MLVGVSWNTFFVLLIFAVHFIKKKPKDKKCFLPEYMKAIKKLISKNEEKLKTRRKFIK